MTIHTTHTPGPWTHRVVGMTRRNTEIMADTKMVALVYGAEDLECASNALLVAAAPDLLLAVEAALGWVESDVQGETLVMLDYFVLVGKLYSALSKATGVTRVAPPAPAAREAAQP